MPNCTILLNSHAGAHHATLNVAQLQSMAQGIGLEADVIGTNTPEEQDAIIDRLVSGGAERLAISGGDGTVNRAVQRLVHTSTALGIIPQGTANNFAVALGLPLDVGSALRVLRDGQIREVDLGKLAQTYFTESAGVGIFADILALYGCGTNKSFARGTYALARVLLSMKAHRLRLYVDGELHSERAVMCIAANSFRIGDGIAVAPDADLTDGALDVVIMGDIKRNELITYYRAFRGRTQLTLPKVSTVRAKLISIEAAYPINAHCDDRVVGTTPITISMAPRALKVVVSEP